MIFLFFFGLVAALVCGGAVLGFLLAIYVFRPRQLGDVLALLRGSTYENRIANTAAVGLIIAALLPAIAGLSYSLSGARWFAEVFGELGKYFWVWVAGAFGLGFLLGLILRGETRDN